MPKGNEIVDYYKDEHHDTEKFKKITGDKRSGLVNFEREQRYKKTKKRKTQMRNSKRRRSQRDRSFR